jgi:hypothetical protein
MGIDYVTIVGFAEEAIAQLSSSRSAAARRTASERRSRE